MSKWLFFDIEASNGHDICSFGYVLTDDNLNVIKQEDVLIQPNKPFTSTVEKMLAYPKELFFTRPKFDKLSDYIFDIISASDVIIGHAFENEIKFLKNACDDCGLSMPNLKYFDTQTLCSLVLNETQTKKQSLEKIVETLGIAIDSVVLHRADDDAYLTMRVLQKLCEREGVAPRQLIDINYKAWGKYVDGTTYEYTDDITRIYKNSIKRYLPNDDIPVDKTVLSRKIAFCRSYQDEQTYKLWTLAEMIVDRGGVIVDNDLAADVYIWDEDASDRFYKKLKENRSRCKYITVDNFCASIGLAWDDIPMHETDNYCPIGRITGIDKVSIDNYGTDKPSNNIFGDLLKNLK